MQRLEMSLAVLAATERFVSVDSANLLAGLPTALTVKSSLHKRTRTPTKAIIPLSEILLCPSESSLSCACSSTALARSVAPASSMVLPFSHSSLRLGCKFSRAAIAEQLPLPRFAEETRSVTRPHPCPRAFAKCCPAPSPSGLPLMSNDSSRRCLATEAASAFAPASPILLPSRCTSRRSGCLGIACAKASAALSPRLLPLRLRHWRQLPEWNALPSSEPPCSAILLPLKSSVLKRLSSMPSKALARFLEPSSPTPLP
mmetsp:Transcript_14724/g.25836  ORF Transcript_14724/g.25836 Transcript_14724/m.25836 type:complete len:258 (-) Transcript_14724:321-1094(-)